MSIDRSPGKMIISTRMLEASVSGFMTVVVVLSVIIVEATTREIRVMNVEKEAFRSIVFNRQRGSG